MMERQAMYKLDKRDTKDLHNEIKTLSEAYTPEWHFTTTDPDIASVIGIIFADQMEANIERFNQMLYQYQAAFVNLLGVSLRPAAPAKAVVLVELADPELDGTVIRKGTQFIGSDGKGNSIIYETESDVYVTGQNIAAAFMVNSTSGAVRPLIGNFRKASLLPEIAVAAPAAVLDNPEQPAVQTEEQIPEQTDDTVYEDAAEYESGYEGFELFDFPDMGIAVNGVQFLHSFMFDTESDILNIHIEGEQLVKEIREGTVKFMYPSGGELIPVENLAVKGSEIRIKKNRTANRVRVAEHEYGCLVLERDKAPEDNIPCRKITFTSEGLPVRPEYLGDSSRDQLGDEFTPFGDELAIYKDAYIGCDRYLSKAGSKVTLSFELRMGVHYVGMVSNEEEDLRPIKRKPKFTWTDTVSDSFIQNIAFEYFNGTGWKQLSCDQDYTRIFEGENDGHLSVSFICPGDIDSVVAGSFQGKAIRMTILKADNCYLSPCNHHYPILKNTTMSYTYDGLAVMPQKCFTISGTTRSDETAKILTGKTFMAFKRPSYTEDALYVGFRGKPEQGPVSMYIELADADAYQSLPMSGEYSTGRGFRPLKLQDHTGMLSCTGSISFMPPDDFAPENLEGHRFYWLRFKKKSHAAHTSDRAYPRIKDMRMNALEVKNIYSLREEPFYMDEVIPHRSFDLFAEEIYEAQVWVNERRQLSESQMYAMAEKDPDNVRMETDYIGNITSFYTRWTEVDNFNHSTKEDRHFVLDRMNSRLHFGDGVHVMIPRETEDVAVLVSLSVCQGASGNLGEGTILESGAELMYVGNINNPHAAFGGSDVESLGSALMRGANRLSGRGRLITEQDYIRELKAFNPGIKQVKCVASKLPDGSEQPDVMSVVVLMSDFRSGSFVFHNVKESIREHLLKSCELAIDPKFLEVTEPIFVSISSEIWLEAESMDDCYMVVEQYTEFLDRYLDPITGGLGEGWPIGTLPASTQLQMKINTIRTKAAPVRYNFVASYTDKSGVHETELDDMPDNPYFLCYGGRTRIHTSIRR